MLLIFTRKSELWYSNSSKLCLTDRYTGILVIIILVIIIMIFSIFNFVAFKFEGEKTLFLFGGSRLKVG